MNTQEEKSSGIRSRLISGVRWNVVEAGIVAASNLVASIITARLLGLEDFGALSIIRSTVYMMASVAGMGLGVTATKYIAELRSSDPSRLGAVLGLCSIISGVTSVLFASGLLLFASQIATNHLHAPHITEQLQIAAVYIFFVTLNGYQIGALDGFEAFPALAKINLIQAAFSLLATFILTWLWGLTGSSVALGLAALGSWFFHHLAIKQELRRYHIIIRYRGVWKEKKIVTSFAFPAAFAGLIGAITVWSCNAFLVRQMDGLAQMAIFSVANNFRSLIMFVPGLVTRVAAPILCNLVGEKKDAGYSRVFWLNIAVSAGASTVVAGLLMVGAPYLLALFGKDFTASGVVVMVIAGMAVVEVIANTLYQPLFAHGKLWWQVRIIICWSVVLVTVTFTTATNYGALGLAYAYLAAHMVSAALYLFVAFQLKKSSDH